LGSQTDTHRQTDPQINAGKTYSLAFAGRRKATVKNKESNISTFYSSPAYQRQAGRAKLNNSENDYDGNHKIRWYEIEDQLKQSIAQRAIFAT